MKGRFVNMIWGLALIMAGGLALAQTLYHFQPLSPALWALIFAGASLLFFLTYFIQGLAQWGWLFPACIFGSLSISMALVASGREDAWVGSLVLFGVGLPFMVRFIQGPRQNWWALIPAWIMLVLGVITVLADRVQGEFIGGLFLLSVALPFLVVYLYNRKNWWALIPGGVLGVLSIVTLLSTRTNDNFIGMLVLLGIALPFYIVYFQNTQHWWALIPAGVMTSIALVVALLVGGNEFDPVYARRISSLMFFGIAAVFFFLWLRRHSLPTDWAAWPAGGLALLGVMVFFFGSQQEIMWPATMIAAGLLILVFSFRKRPTPPN